MPLTSYDDVIAALSAGQSEERFICPSSMSGGSSSTSSTLQYSGNWFSPGYPASGPPPGSSGLIHNSATNNTGGIFYPDVSPYERYLLEWNLHAANITTETEILDRLVSIGIPIITTAGTYACATPTLPRYNGTIGSAAGNRIFIELGTGSGAMATDVFSFTLSYTNEHGVSGRTTQAYTTAGATLGAGTVIGNIKLQNGDYGVMSVQSITVTGTVPTGSIRAGGTAAPVLVIARPLDASNYAVALSGSTRDALHRAEGPIRIYDGATLYFHMRHSNTGSNFSYQGLIRTVWI